MDIFIWLGLGVIIGLGLGRYLSMHVKYPEFVRRKIKLAPTLEKSLKSDVEDALRDLRREAQKPPMADSLKPFDPTSLPRRKPYDAAPTPRRNTITGEVVHFEDCVCRDCRKRLAEESGGRSSYRAAVNQGGML